MIGPFLGVTLVPQVEVRSIMIPIFHDMMDWEQRKNGNFKQVRPSSGPPRHCCLLRPGGFHGNACFSGCQVEAELIDKLDSLVSEGKGDENYRELFSLL